MWYNLNKELTHLTVNFNETVVINKISDFYKNREFLQKIYNDITASKESLQNIDDAFWDEMDSVIQNA